MARKNRLFVFFFVSVSDLSKPPQKYILNFGILAPLSSSRFSYAVVTWSWTWWRLQCGGIGTWGCSGGGGSCPPAHRPGPAGRRPAPGSRKGSSLPATGSSSMPPCWLLSLLSVLRETEVSLLTAVTAVTAVTTVTCQPCREEREPQVSLTKSLSLQKDTDRDRSVNITFRLNFGASSCGSILY